MRSISAYQDPYDYELWVRPLEFPPMWSPICPWMAYWGTLGSMAPYLWGLDLGGMHAINQRTGQSTDFAWRDYPDIALPGFVAAAYLFKSYDGTVDNYVQSKFDYGTEFFTLYKLVDIDDPINWHMARTMRFEGVREMPLWALNRPPLPMPAVGRSRL